MLTLPDIILIPFGVISYIIVSLFFRGLIKGDFNDPKSFMGWLRLRWPAGIRGILFEFRRTVRQRGDK